MPRSPSLPPPSPWPPEIWRVLGVLFGLHSFVAWREQQVRLAAAQHALAEARLHQLRAQLQSHFLFNNLNTVSALFQVDVARADRLLARLSDVLRYLREASYPIYILHQTAIIAVGWFGIRLPLPWPHEYALVLVVTLLICFALYELLIRHVALSRPLFGLRRAVAGTHGQGLGYTSAPAYGAGACGNESLFRVRGGPRG